MSVIMALRSITWAICLLNLIVNTFITICRISRQSRTTANVITNHSPVVILGDSGAGKTSTRKKLCNEKFVDQWTRTSNIEYISVTDFAEGSNQNVHVRPNSQWITQPRTMSPHLNIALNFWFSNISLPYSDAVHTYVKNALLILINLCCIIPFMRIYLHFFLGCLGILRLIENFDIACIISGGFSLFGISHFVTFMFAIVIANIVNFGPEIEQVMYNMCILFIFESNFVSITNRKNWGFFRKILLVFVLLIHQNFMFSNVTTERTNRIPNDMWILVVSVPLALVLINFRSDKYDVVNFMLMLISRLFLYTFSIINLENHVLEYLYQTWIIIMTSFNPRFIDYSHKSYTVPMVTGLLFVLIYSAQCLWFNIQAITFEIILSFVGFFTLKIYMLKYITNDATVKQHTGNGPCRFEKTWHLREFPCKHNCLTHQIYLPRQGVFMVVFDASKSVDNMVGVLNEVYHWVQLVSINVLDTNNSVVILAATHASSLNTIQRNLLCQNLNKKLLYYKDLISNKSGIVFFIDNKDITDTEITKLRNAIGDEAVQLTFVTKPRPYTYKLFSNTISLRQNQQSFKKSELKKKIEMEMPIFNRMSQNEKISEFEDILKFYNNNGELFYEPPDEGDQEYQYVILHRGLQLFEKVVEVLVDPFSSKITKTQTFFSGLFSPNDGSDNQFESRLKIFERTGVIKKSLLVQVFEKLKIKEEFWDIMIHFLKKKLFLYNFSSLNEHSPELYIFPRHLPEEPDEYTGGEDVYISLTTLSADYIFLRLVCSLKGLQRSTLCRNSATFENYPYMYTIQVTGNGQANMEAFDFLKMSIRCKQGFSVRRKAYDIKSEIDNCVYRPIDTGVDTDFHNKTQLWYLCETCGKLTEIDERFGKNPIVTNSHIIKEVDGKNGGDATLNITCKVTSESRW